jgi:DNA-binding LacI/PurR family transcriptional regulator/DNA-binding transcriptional regulator YhcF (GntR family)
MIRDQRFQDVLRLLRRQIVGSFRAGERLPSKRELAGMHSVGPRTIERALKVLTTEGYVQVQPRVGSIRTSLDEPPARDSKKSSLKKLSVGIMTRRSADEWAGIEIYPALLNEATARGIEVVPVPNPHSYRQPPGRNLVNLARVPWNTFDVGLLVEAEDTIRLRDPLLYSRRVLAVDQDATAYGLDSVAFDDVQAGAITARHFLELGHQRFAVTEEVNDPGIPGDPAFMSRRYGFEAALCEAGGLMLPQWRLPVPRRGFKGFHHHFVKAVVNTWASAAPAQRPTALFAVLQHPIVDGAFLDELNKHGIRVPRDLSIIGTTWGGKFYGNIEPVRNGMRYTCVDFDLAALVRRTFDAARRLAAEKTPPDKRTRKPELFLAPVRLLPGETTAPPPS